MEIKNGNGNSVRKPGNTLPGGGSSYRVFFFGYRVIERRVLRRLRSVAHRLTSSLMEHGTARCRNDVLFFPIFSIFFLFFGGGGYVLTSFHSNGLCSHCVGGFFKIFIRFDGSQLIPNMGPHSKVRRACTEFLPSFSIAI